MSGAAGRLALLEPAAASRHDTGVRAAPTAIEAGVTLQIRVETAC
jgi:hypothetical protein